MLNNTIKPDHTRPEQQPEALPAQPVSFDQDGFASHDGIVACYCHDPQTLEYIGKAEMWVSKYCGLPAGAVLDAPKLRPAKNKAVIRDTVEQQWALIEDHRGAVVYRIADGARVILSELGPLSADYTRLEYCEGAVWGGEKWIRDADIANEKMAGFARSKRDTLLAATDEMSIRHREELDMELETTLSKIEYKELLTYRQKLRDLPIQNNFPSEIDWPIFDGKDV